jgi:RTX calcium-binding nonapeptide repeat (4 copies)
MKIRSIVGARPLGLTATVALGVGLASAGSASATVAETASVAGDTLTVNASPHADRLALRLTAGNPNELDVDFGDDGSSDLQFDRTTFSKIVVDLDAGDDSFRVDQVNGVFADEALTVNAGEGDDTVNGGDGAEVTFGGSGNDFVDGNRANDVAFLGAGNDTFRWDPGDGSDTADGSGGDDTMLFFGSGGDEIMRLFANGQQSVFTRNLGTIRMDMDQIEMLDLRALGGKDEVTVDDLTGTDIRLANVDLRSAAGGGDAAADVVIVNGTDQADRLSVSTDGARVDVDGMKAETRIVGSDVDDLVVRTGAGNDSVDVDDDVAAVIGVKVDLGADQS